MKIIFRIEASEPERKLAKRAVWIGIPLLIVAYFAVGYWIGRMHSHLYWGLTGPAPIDPNLCAEQWEGEKLLSYGKLRNEYLYTASYAKDEEEAVRSYGPSMRRAGNAPYFPYVRKVKTSLLFQYDFVATVKLNEKILNDPACLGYLVASMARVRFHSGQTGDKNDGPVYAEIYDSLSNKIMYQIVKYPSR